MKQLLYVTFPSAFGMFSIVWQEVEDAAQVRRIILSNEQVLSESLLAAVFTEAIPLEHPDIVDLGAHIQRFFEGHAVHFELDSIALEACSDFQLRVLLAEYGIPRGYISTYGKIGKHLGLRSGGGL